MISLKERLNQILLERKLISPEGLKEALDIQKQQGGKISEILIRNGLVEKKDLMVALSDELGIPPINLSRFKVDPQIIKLIPRKIAMHYQIIPISKIGGMLTIAMADPLNVFAVDDIKAFTGSQIGVLITTEKDIQAAIDEYYSEDAAQAIEGIIEDLDGGGDALELISDAGSGEAAGAGETARMTQETPVVKVTNLLLSDAVKVRASDILVEPMERVMRIRYRVDGMLRDAKSPPLSMHASIISRLKVMADLDIAERRLPQDGRFKVRVQTREVDFRVSIVPAVSGEKAALRILDKSQAMLDLNRLGFEKDSVDLVRKISKRPHGMIIVCGPTGCGKTTTLYSVLKEIDSPEKNLVTVEDPVEFQLHGINQVSIRPDIGLTFAAALRSILRQDPDVIMVGEIRDYDTADIAIKSALTGHMVLSTLHTTTAVGSVIRLVNMGVEPFLIASSVVLVAAQRLMRRVCPNCREPYVIEKSMFKKMGIRSDEPKLTFYRAKGCRACMQAGYAGRVGLMESLPLTPAIKELICARAQEYEIKVEARKEGMKTLRENGLAKALAGLTTWEEVLRLTVADERGAMDDRIK